MVTSKESLVKQVRVKTIEAITDIVQNHPGKDGSEHDILLIDLASRIARSDMVSSRLITKHKKAAKDTVVSDDVSGRICEEVAASAELMKPIAVFIVIWCIIYMKK